VFVEEVGEEAVKKGRKESAEEVDTIHHRVTREAIVHCEYLGEHH